MSIKKYTNGSWTPACRKYGTETDSITTLPVTIIGDGTPITSYTIKGNMEQNGTPTPSSPIYPSECGDLVTSGEHAGQHKLPLTLGSTTTDIYLGEVQSTRRIKKYTFTGNETIFSCVATTDSQNYCVALRFVDFGMTDIKDFDKIMQNIDYPIFISSHFVEKTNHNSDFNDIKSGEVGANTASAASTNNRYIIFCVSGLTTAAEYSAWFAQQYANGTPVEVYYILETATTAAVNEPLMKIGDYVDSVSGTNLATSGAGQELNIETTLKPSEVDMTYHGWHEHDDTKYST